jgi:hypothetical protein
MARAIAVTGTPATRAAGVTEVALGLGFGLGALWTVQHLGRHGELPMTPWGFRSMSGPFEALGDGAFTVLGLALAGACAADVVAGIWLWQGRRRGLVLGAATAIPSFGLAVGFALPFLLVGVPVRLALAWAGRGSLR